MSFQIKQFQDSENKATCVEISNGSSLAKIVLNQGGSVQELRLNSIDVIQDLHPLTYQNTYASAILFPFASRIAAGKYSFENIAYQTAINELDRNNALHGFVHDKDFQLVDQVVASEQAAVTLMYADTVGQQGFPFTYKMLLTYVLKQDGLEVQVKVINTSTKTFPFTLGWHPYFTCADLYNSSLHFSSDTKIAVDAQLITAGTVPYEGTNGIQIKDDTLDDCYFLNGSSIAFSSPNYALDIRTSEANSFLQVYTPPKENVIAIEPTTGVSNSFNNRIGLKTLAPAEAYEITWQVVLTRSN